MQSRKVHPRVLLATVIAVVLAPGAVLVACGGAPSPAFDPTSGQPFSEPEVISAKKGVLNTTLTVARGPVKIAGQNVVATTYNGTIVGPTLNVAPGDHIELDLVNKLDEPTNIHFHGFHVSPSGNSDNIFIHVMPGETKRYSVQIPDDHPPGTYWYHSHMHGISEAQVFDGLSGVILMDGVKPMLPKGLQGITERVLALRDVQVVDGALPDNDDDVNATPNTTRLVNGLDQPVIDIAPGEAQLWHIANIGANIYYRPAVEGQTMVILTEDGNPLDEPQTVKDLVMPPGKRYDVLVYGPPAGDTDVLSLAYDEGFSQFPRVPLASLHSAGDDAKSPSPPKTFGPFNPSDLADATVAKKRTMVFTEQGAKGIFLINGEAFDPKVVNVRPKLGTVEEWTLINKTNEKHPFHIHVNDFQVMSVNGEPYKAHSLEDTVPLPQHGEVVIRQRFADYTGKFVFHCHILAHEDLGMMQVVDVEE